MRRSSGPAAALVLAAALAATASGTAAADPALPAVLARGLDLQRQGRPIAAEPLLVEGLKASPEHVEGLVALAGVYLGWGDWERGLPLAERAASLAPASFAAQLTLGRAYGLKALNVSKLRAMPLLGKIRAAFERAIDLDPRSVEPRAELVRFHTTVPSLMGGDLSQARAQAEAMVPLDPVRGLRAVAEVATRQGRESEALAAIERLAREDAGQGHLARAAFYGSRKDASRAAAELARVGEADPQDAKDLTEAAIGFQRLERWEDALRLLALAERADGEYLPAVYQVGRTCLMANRDLPRAEAAFRKYLAGDPGPLAPTRASARWRLGMVYERMNRKVDARREYEEALRLEPGHAEAKKSLAALR